MYSSGVKAIVSDQKQSLTQIPSTPTLRIVSVADNSLVNFKRASLTIFAHL
jgi:hypothetical protein